MARTFLLRFTKDRDFIERVCALVRWHMQVMFVAHSLPFADILGMLNSIEPEEVALLAYCDRLGRGKLSNKKVEEEEKDIGNFLLRCAAYQR